MIAANLKARILGAGLLLLAVVARAREPSDVVPSRDPSFKIPFEVSEEDRARLAEVQLYVSIDRGETWRLQASVPPEQSYFPFTARTDGEYWFTVRNMDKQGRLNPRTLAGIAPGLRVLVDTTAPEIELRGVNPVGEQVGIEWRIVDDTLDVESLRVDFRGEQKGDWLNVPIEKGVTGRATWRPGQSGPIDIRLRVLDRAGNEGMREIRLGAPTGIPSMGGEGVGPGMGKGGPAYPIGAPRGPNDFVTPNRPDVGSTGTVGRTPAVASRNWIPADPNQAATISPTPAAPANGGLANPPASAWNNPGSMTPRSGTSAPRRALQVLLVNSTRFQINYSAEEVGRSGLGSVSLYYTLDGIHWEFYGEDEDRESPFLVEVNGEGQYGFFIVARSGAGVGDDPPAQGEAPQVTVEVDITPPEIRLDPPENGVGASSGIVTITWTVHDQNLDSRSIQLSYAESDAGPWRAIAKDIENTGRYQWRVPADAPYKFHVRLEAKDRAGNIGRAETIRPVIVDLARPRIKILKVEPHAPDDLARPTVEPLP